MSTITTKQAKTQGLIDPVFVLTLLVLLLTFAILMPLNHGASNNFGNLFGSFGTTSMELTASKTVSFAADQAYWNANCDSGWSSNETCDAIVQRSQSCAISAESAYCTEYQNYLKNFAK